MLPYLVAFIQPTKRFSYIILTVIFRLKTWRAPSSSYAIPLVHRLLWQYLHAHIFLYCYNFIDLLYVLPSSHARFCANKVPAFARFASIYLRYCDAQHFGISVLSAFCRFVLALSSNLRVVAPLFRQFPNCFYIWPGCKRVFVVYVSPSQSECFWCQSGFCVRFLGFSLDFGRNFACK